MGSCLAWVLVALPCGGGDPSTSLCLGKGPVTLWAVSHLSPRRLASFQWGSVDRVSQESQDSGLHAGAVVVTDGWGVLCGHQVLPSRMTTGLSAGHCPPVPTCPPACHSPLQPMQSPRGLPAASAGTGHGQKHAAQRAGQAPTQPRRPPGGRGPGPQEGPGGRAEWAEM